MAEKVQSVEIALEQINVEAAARETGVAASTLRYDLNKVTAALPKAQISLAHITDWGTVPDCFIIVERATTLAGSAGAVGIGVTPIANSVAPKGIRTWRCGSRCTFTNWGNGRYNS